MTTMSFGRALFALGLLGLGVQNLILADLVPELQPFATNSAARAPLAALLGSALFAAGVALLANFRVRFVAALLAALFALWLFGFFVPALIARPLSVGTWVGAGEILSFAGTSAVLAAAAPHESHLTARWNACLQRHAAPGRIGFALALPLFGAVHFLYTDFLAGMIPAWIAGAVAWVQVTGAARIAAGIALFVPALARAAATLIGLMYGAWLLLLHLPRLAAQPENRAEWTLACIALALCGGAWLIAVMSAQPGGTSGNESIAGSRR